MMAALPFGLDLAGGLLADPPPLLDVGQTDWKCPTVLQVRHVLSLAWQLSAPVLCLGDPHPEQETLEDVDVVESPLVTIVKVPVLLVLIPPVNLSSTN